LSAVSLLSFSVTDTANHMSFNMYLLPGGIKQEFLEIYPHKWLARVIFQIRLKLPTSGGYMHLYVHWLHEMCSSQVCARSSSACW